MKMHTKKKPTAEWPMHEDALNAIAEMPGVKLSPKLRAMMDAHDEVVKMKATVAEAFIEMEARILDLEMLIGEEKVGQYLSEHVRRLKGSEARRMLAEPVPASGGGRMVPIEFDGEMEDAIRFLRNLKPTREEIPNCRCTVKKQKIPTQSKKRRAKR